MEGAVLFGKYKILKPIGKGGMSVVYLAEHIKLKTKWAIKVVDKNQSNLNLLAEPNILKALNHPAIPKIIDIEEDDYNLYIIEEYVEGTNLKEFKEKHTYIDEETIIKWGIELCNILHYLHTRKPYPIIYRDMKPDNIILMNNGSIKLIDFGISREYKYQANSDTVQIGTRGFAAPEQYGGAQSDERTDIYGVGLTLYYLVTGKTLSNPPYKILPISNYTRSYSHQLDNILLTSTSLLPESRFQNTLELKREFNKLITDNKESKKDIIGTVMIGIIGTIARIGVTHTAITLAGVLTDKGYDTAIVELTDSNVFRQIKNMYYDCDDLGDRYIFNKLTFYPYEEDRDITELLTHKHHYILLDLGVKKDNLDLFFKSNVKMVVSGVKDWEIHALEEFLMENQKIEEFYYGFTFTDAELFSHINKNMGSLKCYALPYNPNPYKPDSNSKELFSHILREYLPTKQQGKRRWFRRKNNRKIHAISNYE